MAISMNGHGLDIVHSSSGVRIAECKCGASIHKQMPNRRKPNITIEEFTREANVKHQQHLNNVIERERLKILLNAKYGKTPGTYYQETDSMSDTPTIDYTAMANNQPSKCELDGAHNYTTLNQTTIYCTQCGDVQVIGGVSEEHTNNMERDNNNLIIENRELRAELEFWKSWYKAGAPRHRIERYIEDCLDMFHQHRNSTNSKKQAHAIIESIHGMMERETKSTST